MEKEPEESERKRKEHVPSSGGEAWGEAVHDSDGRNGRDFKRETETDQEKRGREVVLLKGNEGSRSSRRLLLGFKGFCVFVFYFLFIFYFVLCRLLRVSRFYH